MRECHHRYSELCAEIRQACARDCDRMAAGDETMKRCADICRRCQQSCEQMARASV